MPDKADDCVVLFYQGRRYWVGPVTSAAEVPPLVRRLHQLVDALERGQTQLGTACMDGPEK